MKKILITGANGFIGSHLVSHCLVAGFEVLAGVRRGSNLSNLENTDVPIVNLEYLDQQKLKDQLSSENLDIIIHAAGVTVARTPHDYKEGIYTPTKNLLSAAQGNVEKFVFVSSLAARGPGVDSYNNPISLYGKYKLDTEKLIEGSGVPFLNVRPTAVYGSGNLELLPLFKWANRGIIVGLGNKNRKLSFIHVSDLCELILEEMEGNEKMIYASDGHTYTLSETNFIIKQSIGRRKYIEISIPKWLFKLMMGTGEFFVSSLFGGSWRYPSDKVKELVADDWSIRPHTASNRSQRNLKSGFLDTARYYAEIGWI